MAYITVVSTANSIIVDFGVYSGNSASSGVIPNKRIFQKNNVVFSLLNNNEYIEAVTIYNNLTFPITFNGATGTFKVDSINGVAPNDNSDLYYKLIELIA